MEVYSTTSVFVRSKFATHVTYFGDENLHSHTYFEIVYILSGSIGHYCDGRTDTLSRGDFLVLRPNDIHRFHRFDADCTHRDVMIPKELFRTCCDFLSPTLYKEIQDNFSFYESHISDVHLQYFEDQLNHITQNTDGDPNLCEAVISSVVISLLTVFFNRKQLYPNKESGQYGWFQYLLEKFNKIEFLQQGIPALINDISYNHVYICRVFKKIMHCTMTEYLNQSRLKCAENYLRFTSIPVSAIVEQVGFSSASYFNNLFKKKYGISPHQYRLMLRQNSEGEMLIKSPPLKTE